MYRRQEKGLKRKDEEDDEQTILVKEDSPFHAIQFHRIILDEAHTIKVGLRRIRSEVFNG